MIEKDLSAFKKNYREARGYHHRARQFADEGQRPSLVFNVASVAVERYLIALCALHGVMPRNHNYGSLMDSAVGLAKFPAGLERDIRSLDDIFGICSLDEYHHGVPEPADAARVLGLCGGLTDLFVDNGIPIQVVD
jgi:HEPN domain-containing protein